MKDYFRKMSFTSEESKLTSVAALRALGHPTRLRILAHLQLSGDATATECAAEVGESASSCSYHLRPLAQHGFVEQVPTDDGRERRWHSTVHASTSTPGPSATRSSRPRRRSHVRRCSS